MYATLILKMTTTGITKREMAKELHLHENTIKNKLFDGSFSVEEAFAIKAKWFPNERIDRLFERTDRRFAS